MLDSRGGGGNAPGAQCLTVIRLRAAAWRRQAKKAVCVPPSHRGLVALTALFTKEEKIIVHIVGLSVL